MEIKYVHDVMKKYANVFTRNMSISGGVVYNSYRFASNIPVLANKTIVNYSSNTGKISQNVMYDYTALENVDSIKSAENALNENVACIRLTDVNVEKYTDIMYKHAVIAHRLLELKEQDELIAQIENG